MENIFGEDYMGVEIRPQKGVTHNDIKGNGWSAISVDLYNTGN